MNGFTLLSADDLYLFNEGSHIRAYEKLGAHPQTAPGLEGTYFAVWAPSAEYVSVVGDFNGWLARRNPLRPCESSGIWEGFVPGLPKGSLYKYHIKSRHNFYEVDKADPMGFLAQIPPRTASVVWDLAYDWHDGEWMATRKARNALTAPFSIYEVHLGSWRHILEEGRRSLTYRELSDRLTSYVKDMGFTHVEFMPIMEHPFYGSWGYQTTGYFAPTSRYGTPQDFMYLIDRLHQAGIGVILDWVPSHFPTDEHGLAYFDGTHLYEHADPRQGYHPEWHSAIFNYSRNEVRSFLLSSAIFWLDRYHADALRIDAVASILYLDYARDHGGWIPNRYGGNENLEAIGFLRRLNEEVYRNFPDVQTIAEESTAWPMVSRPTYVGGLGFGAKWDMGWMHDTLLYMEKDPIHRRYHHQQLTFRSLYAYHENFVLPLSHDEVVYGKRSLLAKMPGPDWEKFANLRLLFGYMYAVGGKKLLFMGGEFGQWSEWQHEHSLEWHLLQYAPHQGVQKWMRDLNHFYRRERAFHETDFEQHGFEWIDADDADNSVISFLRKSADGKEMILVVCNFTPVPRIDYRLGAPRGGFWREMLNSDAADYGGSGHGNLGGVEASPVRSHHRPFSLTLSLPPLSALYLKP